jgi:hypothetical protein
MWRSLLSIGRARSGVRLGAGQPELAVRPPAADPRRLRRPGCAGWSGRSRAILAGLVAAGLLLPISGGAPSFALAAAPAPADGVVRAAESTDGLTHVVLVPGETEARYIMTVRTFGQPRPASCASRAVTGEIVLAPDGSVVSELSKIVLDQRTLKCAPPLRDNMAQQQLQTAQYPTAELVVTSAPGLGQPLPLGDAAFQLVGDQTVRGLTRSTYYDTTATLTPDGLTGLARTTFKMSTFGITPPSIGPLIQVADDMVAEVNIKATIAAPAPAAAPAGDLGPADDAP